MPFFILGAILVWAQIINVASSNVLNRKNLFIDSCLKLIPFPAAKIRNKVGKSAVWAVRIKII